MAQSTDAKSARDRCFEKMESRFPQWERLWDRTPKLLPDFISQGFYPESTVPIGAICITDCMHTLGAARYALDRYCEVGEENRSIGDEPSAVFFERFYLDDVALRLYSAAEHLANGILAMLELDASAVAEFKTPSQWERVRQYLNKDQPGSNFMIALGNLRSSTAWRFTMGYRGRWVHNQPDLVAGLGILYERKKRWQSSTDGSHRVVDVGTGDAPKHSSEKLAELFGQAFAGFLTVVETVVDAYFIILEDAGIRETDKGLGINIPARTPADA